MGVFSRHYNLESRIKIETITVNQIGNTNFQITDLSRQNVKWSETSMIQNYYNFSWVKTLAQLGGFTCILKQGLCAFENNILSGFSFTVSSIPSSDHILQNGTLLVSEGLGKADAVVSPVKFSVVFSNETGTQKPQRTQWRRKIQRRESYTAEVLPIGRRLQNIGRAAKRIGFLSKVEGNIGQQMDLVTFNNIL